MKKLPGCFFFFLLLGVIPCRGQHAPAFSMLQSYFHQKVDEGQLAGTVMLLAKNGKTWVDAYGMQNIEENVAMQSNTLFRLASMTKPIVSVAVMTLVEEGKMTLEDPVDRYIPDFQKVRVAGLDTMAPLERSLTIRDLLTHTGGITSEFDPSPAGAACRKTFREHRPASLAELVGMVTELPLAHQPGEGWTYSLSTDVLAYIVEIVSGKPIAVFLKEKLFNPLKMGDTGFEVSADKVNRLASVYGADDQGKLQLKEAPANSPCVNGKNFPRGNGGLVSTAGDYLRFCTMLLNKGELDGVRILKPETVQEMMRNQLPPDMAPLTKGLPAICYGFGYGFGVQTEKVVAGSPGDCLWPGAYMTYFFIDPGHNGIGIFMTQVTDFSKMPFLVAFHSLASKAILEDAFYQHNNLIPRQ